MKTELPKYKSHKIVQAAKIVEIEYRDVSIAMKLKDINDPIEASIEWLGRHGPIEPGGYLVRYEDGYESYSPAKAFESGYTRVESCEK